MRLNSIDAGCAWFGLVSGELTDRISWRLARAVRGLSAGLHERFLRSARGLGVPYVPVAWIDSSAPGEARAQAPLYPSPVESGAGAAGTLATLRRGVWNPDGGAPFLLEQSGWGPAEGSGRSMHVCFLWHVLHPAAVLLEGYRAQRQDRDRRLAFALAERWTRTSLYRERVTTVWDDHITAMRALVLCDLWNALGGDGEESRRDRRTLGDALARHAERLALERFYRPGHNHGVTQALALLATASVLTAHPSAARWERLARLRLEEQMRENVSPEGIHREHSPYYHFFVLRQLLAAGRLAAAMGAPLSAPYRERLSRMLPTGASMITPDGSLAPLGDTWQGAPILITPSELADVAPDSSSALRYALSGGAEGDPPSGGIYPEGGLAILRSGPDSGASPIAERYITVRLTTHNTSHIHRDALSLTLYAYGSHLLVDPGGPYGYGDPFRHRFFTTTAAHNTVAVDSESQVPGPCRVLRWDHGPARDLLEAEHRNYAGVLHRRSLFFVRGRYVVVVDRLVSDTAHRYSQRFHFAPDLELERDGSAVIGRRVDGAASLRLVPLIRREEGFVLDRAGEDPAQGWVCTGDLEKQPAWVASCSTEASSALFATLLVPAPGPEPPEATAADLSREEAEGAHVAIRVDGTRLRLQVSADGTATLTEGDA